jgi:hypothetical protein
VLPEAARDVIDSCSLDIAERGGLTPEQAARQQVTTGKKFHRITPERIGQIEERGITKARLVIMLENVLDEHMRSKMPEGCYIETIYPVNINDTARAHIHVRLHGRGVDEAARVILNVDKMHKRRGVVQIDGKVKR